MVIIVGIVADLAMDTLWEDLRKHQAELKGLHLRELLKDEKRNQALTAHY